MARPRAPGRGRRGPRARLGRARPRRGGAPDCSRAACARGRSPPRCGGPARASSTPTTSTRRSAGARSPRPARRAPVWCCICTTTASSAPSAHASTRAGGLRPLPRPRHAPRRAPQLPRQRAPRPSPTPPRWRSGSGGSSRKPTRSSSRARSRIERLRTLGAPIGDVPVHVVPQVQRAFAAALGRRPTASTRSSRRACRGEKGVDVALDACERAGRAARRGRRRPAGVRAARRRARRRPLRRARRRRGGRRTPRECRRSSSCRRGRPR